MKRVAPWRYNKKEKSSIIIENKGGTAVLSYSNIVAQMHRP